MKIKTNKTPFKMKSPMKTNGAKRIGNMMKKAASDRTIIKPLDPLLDNIVSHGRSQKNYTEDPKFQSKHKTKKTF